MAKAKKVTDITGKSLGELQTMLKNARKELFSLRLDNEQRKLKNTSSLSIKRKEIARMLTNMKERMLQENG
ncbi:MAG: 50S ribosomal protein L29 [Candidatus Levyibacteriota bacterium]